MEMVHRPVGRPRLEIETPHGPLGFGWAGRSCVRWVEDKLGSSQVWYTATSRRSMAAHIERELGFSGDLLWRFGRDPARIVFAERKRPRRSEIAERRALRLKRPVPRGSLPACRKPPQHQRRQPHPRSSWSGWSNPRWFACPILAAWIRRVVMRRDSSGDCRRG